MGIWEAAMWSIRTATHVALVVLSIPHLVVSSEALWLQASDTWYGIDGQWSSFSLAVGTPGQVVYLSVATALSETWVVGDGGCPTGVMLCVNARGGVFNTSDSSSWDPLGTWRLGMNTTGSQGNGDYGHDTIVFIDTLSQTTTRVHGALIAAVNDTNYYQGYLGVGARRGKFGSNMTNPLISQLAEESGSIPSHSYGYTAGAYYRDDGNRNGTVASLTLGGYDTLRFAAHDETFSLDPNIQFPTVMLRGVSATVGSTDDAPTSWASDSQQLVVMNDSITAILDSSTPYLWLPEHVCERFANALNLVWNETLGVYIFRDVDQYNSWQLNSSLLFTFTVSSYDNADDFGEPLSTHGVVNITVPPAAFSQVLRYPFRHAIDFGDSGIPYFPLARSTPQGNGDRYIIGRAFMQEAYMIVNYDDSAFSLHQALFPANAATRHSLRSIQRVSNSPYPPYVSSGSRGKRLSRSQTVGIAVSIFSLGGIIAACLWFCLGRRRRKREARAAEETGKSKREKSIDEKQPRSRARWILGRLRMRKPTVHALQGNFAQPLEVGADAQHQLHEMLAPVAPAELDSQELGTQRTEVGTDDGPKNACDVASDALNRQLQGPVPAHTAVLEPRHVKSLHDVSAYMHRRHSDAHMSTASSPTHSNAHPCSLPSPLTPIHPDWSMDKSHWSNSGQGPRQIYSPFSVGHTGPSTISPSSVVIVQTSDPRLRAPIDPSSVVCLGPLSGDLQPTRAQQSLPSIRTREGVKPEPGRSSVSPPSTPSPITTCRTCHRTSSDTLGSDYTVQEMLNTKVSTQQASTTAQLEEMERQTSLRFQSTPSRHHRSLERIEAGDEIVHVPHVPDRRYSWEEDRR